MTSTSPFHDSANIHIVIPALNEALSIRRVIESIPGRYRANVVVVDNGSSDETPLIAESCGATVIYERQRGYGAACLRGIEEAFRRNADVLVFLDGDSSDDPRDIERLVGEMFQRDLELVIGSRARGLSDEGAVPFHARLGNLFATWLLWLRYGYRFTDLGPLRAIRSDALRRLKMQDRTFGWTIEMQAKALYYKLRVGEIPVHYRKRVGRSKISGTVTGSICAGIKILWVALKHCCSYSRSEPVP